MINSTDESGFTALSLACAKGFTSFASLLLEAGADLNIITVKDTTALIEAATWDRLDCAQLLIEGGADVNFRTSICSTLYYSSIFSDLPWVNKLLSVVDPIMEVAMFDLETCLDLLIEEEADVNETNRDEFSSHVWSTYICRSCS